ncbi:MAG: NAD-dependent epimerase/dehydratase family protein, partial [Dehalococcoidia bacterium]
MNVLVTGASGLVGAALTRALVARGDDVTGISRNPETQPTNGIAWTRWSGLAEAVAGADAVVHLAGADVVAQRWSSARKQELRSSRIDTAAQIARTIRETADKPRVFVSASAVGYYGSRGDEQLTEDATPGSDFLACLCQDWEAAAQSSGIRTVVLRTGVVLAREGGALPKLLRP